MKQHALRFAALCLSIVAACGPMSVTPNDAAIDGAISDGANPDAVSADSAVVDDASPLADASTTWDVAPLPPGDPITAPMEQWTWVPFTDALCGNGSPTGIAVNLTNRSTKVFVYMMGGGACWDFATCYGLRTAANLDTGYGSANFNNDRRQFDSAGIFNRADMTNPFRDASYVFIPYCTGDVHAGNRVTAYDESAPMQMTHHVGAPNVAAFLRRLVPTFPMVDKVWLTGSSAGGVGATLNWPRFQAAFPRARVDLLNDAGQLVDANPGRVREWRRAWALAVPPDCPECATTLSGYINWMHRTMTPAHRSGLMATLQDQTLVGFFTVTAANFETATRQLLMRSYDGQMNRQYFVMPGRMHTYWGNWQTIMAGNGTTVKSWITAWANDEAGWRNVGP